MTKTTETANLAANAAILAAKAATAKRLMTRRGRLRLMQSCSVFLQQNHINRKNHDQSDRLYICGSSVLTMIHAWMIPAPPTQEPTP